MRKSTPSRLTSRVCAEPRSVSRVIALMLHNLLLHNLLRHFRVLLAGALVLAGPIVCAQGYTEGVQYKPLAPAQPTNVEKGKVEVVEVFWYGCSHCYAIEPMFESWR